ncbi:MAG: VWA domain-containing protein [bacterium]|nr:VWA domain-containing protein [bacterium]
MWSARAIAAVVLLGWLPCAAQPLETTGPLSERAKVRVRTVSLRIEPKRHLGPGARAEPGACREFGLDALALKLRGRPLASEQLVELKRARSPTIHALLIDTSGSMIGRVDRTKLAATRYVEMLDPAYESATVMTFDESVLLVEGVTNDRVALADAVERLQLGGYTSMNDGLVFAIRELDSYRERPVLLLLTDGWDTSSLYEQSDVRELAASRPDLSVFVIGIELPPLEAGGGKIKRFLQNLARNTNGEFFDVPVAGKLEQTFARIREMLSNEATLTFVDPNPEAELGNVKVRSTDPNCRVTVFRHDAEPPENPARVPLAESRAGLPQRLELPPDDLYLRRTFGPLPLTADPDCGDHASGLDELWFVETEPSRLRGCALDVTQESGMLYEPMEIGHGEINGYLGLKIRPFEIPLPPPRELPTDPSRAMDRLARQALRLAADEIEGDPRKRPREWHARPYHDQLALQSGRVFLDLRPRLAHAMYRKADYRDWVRARLREEAGRELEALAAAYRASAPGIDEASIAEALRTSEEGRAIRRHAETPSEVDLQRYLTAWLGDISAFELFVRWEGRATDGLTAAAPQGEFAARWDALRRLLFVPSYARVLTILDPSYDPEARRIGFWRVVLPRPSWFLPRVQGPRHRPDYAHLPLDLVPERPYAYELARDLFESVPRLSDHLRRRGYRAQTPTYELTSKPRHQDPRSGYRKFRVTLVWNAPEPEPSTLRIEAELERPRGEGPHVVLSQEIRVEADPELEALLPLELVTEASSRAE